MARKRKRVPKVLWRLFGNRARTLADTILALIPPPPDMEDRCRCKGRRCLSCSGGEAMSFLVRTGDSSDYRKLLTGCFVVVSENAPSIPVFDPQCRWSQREVRLLCLCVCVRSALAYVSLCGYLFCGFGGKTWRSGSLSFAWFWREKNWRTMRFICEMWIAFFFGLSQNWKFWFLEIWCVRLVHVGEWRRYTL